MLETTGCGVFHDKLFPCRLLLQPFTGSTGIKVLCLTFIRTMGKRIKECIVKCQDNMRFVLHSCKMDPLQTNHSLSLKTTTAYVDLMIQKHAPRNLWHR